jgi:hypothetical protein
LRVVDAVLPGRLGDDGLVDRAAAGQRSQRGNGD